jgi:hypothetical protein
LCFSVNKTQGLFGLPSELKHTSTIIIRVTYAWKEGVSSASVSAAHKNLAEFIGSKTPGRRVFRYGLDAYNRQYQAYEVYDSPEAVQQMVNAALSEGSPLGPMYEVVSPIPGHLLIQGSKRRWMPFKMSLIILVVPPITQTLRRMFTLPSSFGHRL